MRAGEKPVDGYVTSASVMLRQSERMGALHIETKGQHVRGHQERKWTPSPEASGGHAVTAVA